MILAISMFLPALLGLALPFLSKTSRALRNGLSLGIQGITLLAVIYIFFKPQALELWTLSPMMTISYGTDGMGSFFALLISLCWILVSVFSIRYMDHYHSSRENLFMVFCLLTESALISMCYADNLFSMYLSYELVTLCSLPLVLQDRTPDAIKFGLKYLFYSMAGAFMALTGMFLFIIGGNESLMFADQLSLGFSFFVCNPKTLLGVFLMCLGFGTKAGLFPMQGWLPTAHPVAPAPASALLSGLVAKAGVLGVIRVLYYLASPRAVAGTWVQTVLLSLAVFTVFMGSMMAYREQGIKKRLAYSTVSQISYALIGIFLLTSDGLQGAMLQVVFHAVVKICLFLSAGAFIYTTGKTEVKEFNGIGRTMPMTLLCFTLASISLIGIPPTGGFESKWQLCLTAMGLELGILSWLIPVVLLVSAVLTAGYLLPIVTNGFFPGKTSAFAEGDYKESKLMWIPMIILVVIAFGFGMFSDFLLGIISGL